MTSRPQIDPAKARATEIELSIDSSKAKYGTLNPEYARLAMKLMKDYAKLVSAEIMSGMTFKIPMRLGFIKIEKTTGGQPINWLLSKQLKQKIVHKNYNTGGYIYKWRWAKYNHYTIFLNRDMFKFIPTRKNKRDLCKYIQNGVFY